MIINSKNISNSELEAAKALRIERIFIGIFVVDMFVKMIFHFNGHKYSNDVLMMQESNISGQNEEQNNNDSN
jgi:hypothetical protein